MAADFRPAPLASRASRGRPARRRGFRSRKCPRPATAWPTAHRQSQISWRWPGRSSRAAGTRARSRRPADPSATSPGQCQQPPEAAERAPWHPATDRLPPWLPPAPGHPVHRVAPTLPKRGCRREAPSAHTVQLPFAQFTAAHPSFGWGPPPAESLVGRQRNMRALNTFPAGANQTRPGRLFIPSPIPDSCHCHAG